MPAPNRQPPVITETTTHAFTKGIVGVYTDLEIDALLAALPAGGGPAPDLSAYATTAYVDGKLATVYTKAEVDAALANVATGGTVDLTNYATTDALEAVKTEIVAMSTAAFQERYTKSETDDFFVRKDDQVAPPNLDGYATEQYVDDSISRIPPADLSAELDAKADKLNLAESVALNLAASDPPVLSNWVRLIVTAPDFRSSVPALDHGHVMQDIPGLYSSLENMYVKTQVDEKLDLKADKATTYTKAETDAALAGVVSGDLSQAQIDAIISQVGPVDLTAYAKLDDQTQDVTANAVKAQAFTFTKSGTVIGFARLPGYPDGKLGIEVGGPGGKVETVAYTSELSAYAAKVDAAQNIVANGMVAKGYTFGDTISGSNPGLVYTDTGEGYGPRLAFDTPGGLELIPYQSDFAPLRSRLDALEGKAAPVGAVDPATYLTRIDADARYPSNEAFTLLQGQVQTIFSSIYTQAEADARYTTKIYADSTFQPVRQMSLYALKTDVYEYVKTVVPTSAANINDPALADFRASVLDEVRKMMTGGKTIPADVPWTKLTGTGSTVAEAKVLNGVVYLRGVVTKSIGAGYIANAFQLPATIPPPPAEMVIPLACKNTSPAGRYYGYATFQTNRQIGVSCDNALNTVWLDGISYPAYD